MGPGLRVYIYVGTKAELQVFMDQVEKKPFRIRCLVLIFFTSERQENKI